MVLRTLGVGGALPGLGAQAPLPRLPGRGSPLLPRNGEKEPGLRPWTPGIMAARSHSLIFWDRCFWYDSGAITSDMLRPIWGAFSGKKYAEKHFLRKTVPKSGHEKWLQMKTTIVPAAPHHTKTSEWERAGHKPGGSRGQGPRRSFLRLSPEKAGLPPGVGREPTSQVLTCAGAPPGVPPPKQTPPPGTLFSPGGGIYCKSVCRQGIVGMPPPQPGRRP